MRAADLKRQNSIKAQSINPFGRNYPTDYQTPTVQRNVKGFKPGDDLHHRAIVSVYEPFFTGLSERESLAMVEVLQNMGVMPGNNPRNFTPMTETRDHQGGIHQHAINYGLQLKGDDLRAQGKALSASGELMPGANDFFDKIRNSTYDQRVAALPDFIEYGQDEIDRILRDEMGYEVPTRAEQRALYLQDVDAEHNQIVDEYQQRKAAKAMGVGTDYKAGDLTKLLKGLRTLGDVFVETGPGDINVKRS